MTIPAPDKAAEVEVEFHAKHEHTHQEDRPLRVVVINQRPANPGTTSTLDAEWGITYYYV